ncbi:hypothetical protein ABIB94_008744, partial [Bradyrhizobium sp. JR7.2]
LDGSHCGPLSRGPDWMPITPNTGSLFHAETHQAPGSLGVDDTYAVAAYLLSLNGILPMDGKLDKQSLPKVQMPNRNGFVPVPEFDYPQSHHN